MFKGKSLLVVGILFLCLIGVSANNISNSSIVELNETIDFNITNQTFIDTNESVNITPELNLTNQTFGNIINESQIDFNETNKLNITNETFDNINESVNMTVNLNLTNQTPENITNNDSENGIIKNESLIQLNKTFMEKVVTFFTSGFLVGNNYIFDFFFDILLGHGIEGDNYKADIYFDTLPRNVKGEGKTISFTLGNAVDTIETLIINLFDFSNYGLIQNQSINISVDVSGYESLILRVDRPDGSNDSFSVDTGEFIEYNNTDLTGRYNVSLIANNSRGIKVVEEDYFEVFKGVDFEFFVEDGEGGIDFDWSVFYRDRIVNGSSELSNFSATLPDALVDLKLSGFGGRVYTSFIGVNLTLAKSKKIIIDQVNVTISNLFGIFVIKPNITFINASVELNYSEFNLSAEDENNLNFYKCSDWDLILNKCNSVWISLDFDKDKDNNLASVNVSSFSAFGLNTKDYMCGDSICNSLESFETCPADCDLVPTSSGSSSGGGGGSVTITKPVNEDKINNKSESRTELPKKLFDIKMELEDRHLSNASRLIAIVTYESFGSIPTPVNLTFDVYDAVGNLIYSKEDSIVVTVEEVGRYTFEDLNLVPGEYEIVLTTLYKNNVSDEFRQSFSIDGETFVESLDKTAWTLLVVVVVLLIVIFILFRRYRVIHRKKDLVSHRLEKIREVSTGHKRKKEKKEKKKNLNRPKKRKLSFMRRMKRKVSGIEEDVERLTKKEEKKKIEKKKSFTDPLVKKASKLAKRDMISLGDNYSKKNPTKKELNAKEYSKYRKKRTDIMKRLR